MAAPAQVTNVAAAGINQGIIATWTISPEVDVAGYQTRVTQAGAQVRDWTNVAGDRMTAAVIIGGLTNGLAYAVTVRAVNSSNEFSMASAEATATPVDVVLRQVYEDVDLTGLAPPPVVEQLGYEAILTAMTADLRARDPDFDAWVESEPVMKLLEIAAYRELLLRYRINQAARSVMLAYAAGADLDHLGALLGVTRSTGETDEQLRRRPDGPGPAAGRRAARLRGDPDGDDGRPARARAGPRLDRARVAPARGPRGRRRPIASG